MNGLSSQTNVLHTTLHVVPSCSPVILAMCFLVSTGFQRKRVKSSDPDTNLSGSLPLIDKGDVHVQYIN